VTAATFCSSTKRARLLFKEESLRIGEERPVESLEFSGEGGMPPRLAEGEDCCRRSLYFLESGIGDGNLGDYLRLNSTLSIESPLQSPFTVGANRTTLMSLANDQFYVLWARFRCCLE